MTITAESKFVELMRSWLVSLPHDLKIAFDAMDDENLPRAAREIATGAVIYVISPNDTVSDRTTNVVSYADDALLLRIALDKALPKGEDEDAFRARFPELFDDLDDSLKLCREILGDLHTWLEAKVGSLKSSDFKGKKVPAYLDNDEAREQIFEDGMVFRTDYPVDEKTIGDKFKKAATVIETMKRRKSDEARAKGLSA